jgi:hypothetical protein
MKSSRAGLTAAVAAVLLVVGVTIVQGMWTDRWVRIDDGGRLKVAAELLEKVFPRKFGDWSMEKELESDPKELERAGAVGHISRVYRHARTKTPISAFVVCASPHDASGHTPDRCYPGAGFEIAEAEHRHPVTLADGREAETFTGTFRKSGQTLRVFWTYGVRSPNPEETAAKPADPAVDAAGPGHKLRWIAPGIARIALNGEPAVYKLYAIMDQTKLSGSQATFECADFLSSLLPDLDDEIASAEGFPRVVPEPAEASSARGQEKPAGETSGGATAG